MKRVDESFSISFLFKKLFGRTLTSIEPNKIEVSQDRNIVPKEQEFVPDKESKEYKRGYRLELKSLKDNSEYEYFEDDSEKSKNFRAGVSDAWDFASDENQKWDALGEELINSKKYFRDIHEDLYYTSNAYRKVDTSDLPKKEKEKLKSMFKSTIIDYDRTVKSIDEMIDYISENRPYPEL